MKLERRLSSHDYWTKLVKCACMAHNEHPSRNTNNYGNSYICTTCTRTIDKVIQIQDCNGKCTDSITITAATLVPRGTTAATTPIKATPAVAEMPVAAATIAATAVKRITAAQPTDGVLTLRPKPVAMRKSRKVAWQRLTHELNVTVRFQILIAASVGDVQCERTSSSSTNLTNLPNPSKPHNLLLQNNPS